MKKNLEKLFRDKFENYKVKPSDKVWSNIEAELNKMSFISKTKKILNYSAVIISVLSLMLLSFIFINNKNKPAIIKTPKITEINKKIQVRPLQKIDKRIITEQNNETNTPNFAIVQYSKVKYVELPPKKDETGTVKDSSEIAISVKIQNFDTVKKAHLQISNDKGCPPLITKINSTIKISELLIDNNQVEIRGGSLTVTFTEEGKHLIIAKLDRCYDTAIVEVYPKPQANFEIPDTFTLGKSIYVSNITTKADKYEWNFGDGFISVEFAPNHKYERTGTYPITLIAINDYGCSDTITKSITIIEAQQYIIFPNAFIPNKNGPTGGYYSRTNIRNDVFFPVVVKKDVSEYKLTILDRNGNTVFISNDINIGWDGYQNGKLVPVGTYVYIAEGKFIDGETFLIKGAVSVIYSY